MSPLPTQFQDRWQNRKEAHAGQGTVYWHILMGGHPQVCELARQAREQISGFSGLHITPEKWLHTTTLIAGATDNISRDQMNEMLHHASDTVGSIAPVSVRLGRVLYHPEAIMLEISPKRALDPVREAVRIATSKVVDPIGRRENTSSEWTPHVTVAYSIIKQPAAPIIASLGKELPSRAIIIDTVTLVVQWGPERRWDWETVGAVRLRGVSGSSDF